MRALRPAAVAALALAACSSDFTPRSVLTSPRVVAVLATPLEVGPGDGVTLAPVSLPAPPAAVGTWTFCPFSLGASVGYACAVPACEVALPVQPDGSTSAEPGALVQACLARLAAQPGGLPAGVPAQLPRQVDLVFRYRPAAGDDAFGDTVQLVPFFPGGAPPPGDPERNEPPQFESQTMDVAGEAVPVGGTAAATLAPGHDLGLHVQLTAGSAQPYHDETGALRDEALFVSFYTTAGRFDFDRANGPDAEVKLKFDHVDPGTTQARLWAVARDNRGGQAVLGPFVVNVAAPPP